MTLTFRAARHVSARRVRQHDESAAPRAPRGHRRGRIEACELDRIAVSCRWPAAASPRAQVSARARLTMAVRAFADLDHVVVSDSEVERGEDGRAPATWSTPIDELRRAAGAARATTTLRSRHGSSSGPTRPRRSPVESVRPSSPQLARIVVVQRPAELGDTALEAVIGEARGRRGGSPCSSSRCRRCRSSSTAVRDIAATGDRTALGAVVPAAIVDDVLQLYGPCRFSAGTRGGEPTYSDVAQRRARHHPPV